MAKAIGKKVLIVEDEPSLREVLATKLKEEGISASTANDGQQGLDAVKKGSFDMILLDILMPVMDGFSMLENMNSQGIKIPTVMLSNISQSEEKKRAHDLGAIDYIIKSNESLSDLVEYVKKHI
jgi:DNA-binding response OmpR family regulator